MRGGSGLRSLQIIVGALIAGVVSFGCIAIVIAPVGVGTADPAILRMVGFLMLMTTVPAALILRHVMLRPAGRPTDRNPYAEPEPRPATGSAEQLQRFVNGTIMGCALLEGTALFGLIVYLLTADAPTLLVVALPLVLMIVVLFPTEGRWRRFSSYMQDGTDG